MRTEDELPTRTPAKSSGSATSSGRVLFTCPAVLYDARPLQSPGPSSAGDANAAAQVTSPVPASETPPVPQTPPVPETPPVPPTPQLAPKPARGSVSPPPGRGRSRAAIVVIALAAVGGVAAIPMWPRSDDEPHSSRSAPAPSSSASAGVTATSPADKGEAQPRVPQSPAGATNDAHVADKAAATPPAPAPVVRKPAFRPRLPQPEIVGEPRDVDDLEPDRTAEEQRPGTGSTQGVPVPGFGGAQPARQAPSPPPR